MAQIRLTFSSSFSVSYVSLPTLTYTIWRVESSASKIQDACFVSTFENPCQLWDNFGKSDTMFELSLIRWFVLEFQKLPLFGGVLLFWAFRCLILYKKK